MRAKRGNDDKEMKGNATIPFVGKRRVVIETKGGRGKV
jgi:hypothetical protein